MLYLYEMAKESRINTAASEPSVGTGLATVGSNTAPVKVASGSGGGKRGRSGGKGKKFGAGGSNRPSFSALAPRNTANSPTLERNDPLWSSGQGGEVYVPIPEPCYIYPGAEVLPHLVAVMHGANVSLCSGYARRVPECVFGYYVAVVTWQRMLWLERANGFFLSRDESQFVDAVVALDLRVPRLLAHFLSGFGNVRIPSGREARFRLLDRPNYRGAGRCTGLFGRVSAETQPLYQNYPCLGVYALRILSSLGGNPNMDWTLPDEVLPVGVGGMGPSRAMLGYGHREPLSQEHTRFLQAVGFYDPQGDFPSSLRGIPFCNALLAAVMTELDNVNGIILDPLPMTLLGSQAQLSFAVYQSELARLFEHFSVSRSHTQVPIEVSAFAKAFIYRVHHAVDDIEEDEAVVAPWCVWSYEREHAGVWGPMVNAGNVCRDREPGMLNDEQFQTSAYSVRSSLLVLEMSLRNAGH